MYITDSELNFVISKFVATKTDYTYLRWALKTTSLETNEPVIVIVFSPNDDPNGRIIIERTISELIAMERSRLEHEGTQNDDN